MTKRYTERDKEVLLYILQYQHENGYSPSVRDISNGCYMSASTAQRHLYKLVELGYLMITPKTPRSIVVKVEI